MGPVLRCTREATYATRVVERCKSFSRFHAIHPDVAINYAKLTTPATTTTAIHGRTQVWTATWSTQRTAAQDARPTATTRWTTPRPPRRVHAGGQSAVRPALWTATTPASHESGRAHGLRSWARSDGTLARPESNNAHRRATAAAAAASCRTSST